MGLAGVRANHPAGVMCAAVRPVSVSCGAMTLDAAMPLVAVSVLAWVMIGLPIVLAVVVAVMYFLRRRPTDKEIEDAHQASEANTAGPADVERRLPGA
jgi:hypothetical protein